MKQIPVSWLWLVKRLTCLVVATILFACILSLVITEAQSGGSDQPAWAAPSAMALRRASSTTGAQSEPILLDNLDCSLLDYRLVSSSTMSSGCFSDSAFGLMNSDDNTVIFNGTDEALRLVPYSAHEILVPWPGTTVLVALDAINTGGTIMTLYRNPVPLMQDQRDLLGRLVAKQLIAPPELPVLDPAGQRLVINPQTMAFSDGGSWLVAETVNGSFVRINLSSLQVTAFARSYVTQGSPGALGSHVAVTGDGRFVAIANDTAAEFKVYDLSTCDGAVNNLQPQHCQSYDYRSFVGQQVSALRYIRHVRFINNGLLSFEARTDNPTSGGIYQLAPTGSITFLTDYLGLGDSYTAGEGAFNYLSGTDTADNMCHLSRHSYPLLLTEALFTAAGGHSVACSGAVTNDLASTSDSYRGQMRDAATWRELRENQPQLVESVMTNFAPGYLAQHRFAQRWQPRIMTVSVGGNDIGFGDLLQSCVIPRVSIHASANTCFSTYEDRQEVLQLTDRSLSRWTALFRQLQRATPESRLYVVGYPLIALDSGNCGRNVNFNQSELEFATSLITYLNSSIQRAAQAANVTYVDISQALVGFRLCEAASYTVAVNGLTAGKDGGPLGTRIFGKESYHPNAFGQYLMSQAILRATHNLTTAPAPANVAPSQAAVLQNAPKSGRVVQTRIPATNLTAGTVKRDTATPLQAKGAENGLKPRASYAIRLDGSNGLVVGAATSDGNGDIGTVIIIPAAVQSGGHTIEVTGSNQVDQPVTITQPIYVLASDGDADGDEIPDSLDTCPGAIQSGADTDQDGVDDICDPLIGMPAPSASTPPSGTGTSSITHDTPHSELVVPTIVSTFQAPQVLGATTTNPQALGRQSEQFVAAGAGKFTPTPKTTASSKPYPRTTKTPANSAIIIKTIDWRPWVAIPFIAWWLLMLAVYCCWLALRRDHRQSAKLSKPILPA